MPAQDPNLQNVPVNESDSFDPTKDIDLSAIESGIIDTSKGDKIDYEKVAYNKVFRVRCRNCGYYYGGATMIEKCPRCGSTDLDDSQTV